MTNTAKEKLTYAKRFLKNAKVELKKAGIDLKVGIYRDLKYVTNASGTAYLAGLEVLKAILVKFRVIDEKDIVKKLRNVNAHIENLKKLNIGKDGDVLLNLFNEAYIILHVSGYYRELRDKKAIDSGFEKVEKIIEVVEKYVGDEVKTHAS